MKITIISAALPPQLDGIGDYTALLGAELVRRGHSICFITNSEIEHTLQAGIEIEEVFSISMPQSFLKLEASLIANPPDWLLLQYNPFGYGKWGWNPYLPLLIRRLKRRFPALRFAMMAHETFVNPDTLKLRIMRLWQVPQFMSLARSCDALFFSTQAWIESLAPKLPGKKPVLLPVGSNLPCLPIPADKAKERLGIHRETLVLGIFGTAHPSRLLRWIGEAVRQLYQTKKDIQVLYIGPDSEVVRPHFVGIPLLAEGPLGADEVSRRLSAVDIFLSPFIDGVTTRRSSFIVALQHCLPIVGTYREETEAILQKQNGDAFLLTHSSHPEEFYLSLVRLANSPNLRQEMGEKAGQLYDEHFSWSRIVETMLEKMNHSEQVMSCPLRESPSHEMKRPS